jgi:Undecaprenyl-phosphate glucose phosphotransferase
MDYGQAFFLYIAAVKLCDVLTVLGLWYGCWYLRFNSTLFPITKGIPNYESYSAVTLPLALVFSAVLHIVGAYRRDRIHFGFRCTKKIVEGCVLGLLVFIATVYFRGEVDYSRLYLIIFLSILIPTMLLERAVLQIVWNILEKSFVRRIRILLMGGGKLLSMYVDALNHRRPYPIEWVGRLGDPHVDLPIKGIAYLGSEERLPSLLDRGGIDSVVISYPTESSTKYGAILESVANELVEIKVLPDFGKYSTFSYQAEQECGIPLLQFNHAPVGATDRAMKRLLDISGSLAFMLFFAPLYATIALLIKITSRGPVLYSQARLGADGRVFTLYKFRSMRLDAEVETGAVWAKPNDDRTTPLGKWLRRTSLDELPQFYNVLRGDMSLVGPRPERPVFVEQFRREIPKYMLRHKMKSGITGWAQVNGWRGNTSLEERIKHDLYYIGHWSHFFDIKILCLTVIKGFVHRHAY